MANQLDNPFASPQSDLPNPADGMLSDGDAHPSNVPMPLSVKLAIGCLSIGVLIMAYVLIDTVARWGFDTGGGYVIPLGLLIWMIRILVKRGRFARILVRTLSGVAGALGVFIWLVCIVSAFSFFISMPHQSPLWVALLQFVGVFVILFLPVALLWGVFVLLGRHSAREYFRNAKKS